MPDWYDFMRLARRRGVPFWPGASVLDIPTLVLDWYAIAAEAEAIAVPELERLRARRAARAAQPPTPVRRYGS